LSAFRISLFGAAGEVTGSCYLVEINSYRVLVDCGLFQGGTDADVANSKEFPFDARTIDAVVLTHAHIDHSGRLPLLNRRGFSGPIYTHRGTADLCRIMLKDSAFLIERDCEWDNRKRARRGLAPVDPLYTQQDAGKVLRKFKPQEYNQKFEILPGIVVRLQDAGHILGSAIIELWVNGNGVSRKIVFSGDLGHKGAPIMKDPAFVSTADLVFMESTYGDRSHRSWSDTLSEIGEIIESANNHKGNILIPCFSVGRSQELLHLFAKHFDDWGLERWQIFLDSPMAIEATRAHQRHPDLLNKQVSEPTVNGTELFSPPNLHFSHTNLQSMSINKVSSGAIIIAGSGMCTGGRIRHHLKHNVWRKGSHVMIVGFQARGTLGRKLVDGTPKIRLWGEEINVEAKIHTVGGLSAHADVVGLSEWIGRFQPKPVLMLVHGETNETAALQQTLKASMSISSHTPSIGDVVDLRKMELAQIQG
jgi:metallo-beta-lactamase family protein